MIVTRELADAALTMNPAQFAYDLRQVGAHPDTLVAPLRSARAWMLDTLRRRYRDVTPAIEAAYKDVPLDDPEGYEYVRATEVEIALRAAGLADPACPDACPVCGVDLAREGYPVRHQSDEGDLCRFTWSE